MFERIAVVNRGEPAMRLIRAVRELNEQHGYGIRVIAMHTEDERHATFVRAADESVVLRDTGKGIPYLDHGELGRALTESRADAAWVGWGFVAEDPAFAELCASLGVTFIGPPADAMRLLGAKIEAKVLAEQTGVPVAAWSGGPVQGVDDGLRHAATIGYPLIIKSRSGGGGRGIRIVRSEDELADALERTQIEAQRTFGDPVIFMERLVEGGRHIEVQVIADQHGNVWAPGVRDCSVQRRNQKLIEESSSAALSPEQDASLRESAKALVKAAGYVNAGTVEFLYQPQEKLFTFLEVNTRLQVEHTVTEATTGLDIVKLQLHVASGGRLDGEPPAEFGHAVEARLNAEDAEQEFAPAPGTVEFMRLPTGPGVRVDTGMSVGDAIPPTYDSMVAKIIAWGRDRPEALARLRCALRDTTVVIRGGTTTKSFLLSLLDRPEVVAGTADTAWLDRTGTSGGADPERHAAIALIQVAIDVSDAEETLERAAFRASARGGRPRAAHDVGRVVELGYRGQSYKLTVAKVDPDRYRVELDGSHVDVDVDRLSALESRLTVCHERYSVVASHAATSHLVEVDGVTHRVTRDEEGVVRAPAPAVVVAVRVNAGDDVEAGQTIVVLESMKMETAVRAPLAGKVREVLAVVNAQVDAGAALMRLEPVGDEGEKVVGERVALPGADVPSSGADRDTALDVLAEMQALITGYDVTAEHGRQLVAEYATARGELPVDEPDLLHGELALLTTFADLSELSRNRPTSAEEEADEQVHSPREHFHSYLHSLDIDLEGLPESFRARLSRALLHYGVSSLEPGPALEEAVFRIFLAQQRTADQLPVVLALLDRWLTAGELPIGPLRDELAEVLDRLIVATQLRYPSVGDVARAVRFRYFEKPLVQQARQEVVDQAERLLAELTDSAGGPQDMERVQALVLSPEPLIQLLGRRIASPPAGTDPVLEVLTRRYYRRRSLENLRSFLLDGRTCVTGDYELSGSRLHLLALMAQHADLPAVLSSLATLVAETADPSHVVVDLYLSWPDRPSDADELADTLRGELAELDALRSARRVTVTVCTPSGDVETVTFRPSPRRARRGGGHPRDAPADRAAPRPLAAEELQRPAAALGRGHVPAPRRREGEPQRPAAHRHGGGARRDAADQRRRRGRRLPDGRTAADRLHGQPAAGEGVGGQRPPARPQPDLPVRLAVHRAAARRSWRRSRGRSHR